MLIILTISLQTIIAVSSSPYCVPQLQEYKVLNDGNRIPALALGTWTPDVSVFDMIIPSVTFAIEIGYRHLDTAHLYANELLIGEALSYVFQRGIVQREDMFITSKMDIAVSSGDMVVASLKRNLWRLQLDYLDLFLIHTPYNTFDDPNFDIIDIWRGMEDAKKLGLVRSIGISNFNSSQVNRLLKYAEIRPAVNEIEVNPTFTSLDLVAYCQSQGIVVMGYAPFGYLVDRTPYGASNESLPPTFEDPTLVKLAKKYGKLTSQVVIRHLIDLEIIPIPRSHNRSHIFSNMDVFDFSLNEKEIYTLNEFNRNIPVYFKDEEDMSPATREQYNIATSLQPC